MRTAVFALIVTLGLAAVPADGIRAQDLNAAVADRVAGRHAEGDRLAPRHPSAP